MVVSADWAGLCEATTGLSAPEPVADRRMVSNSAATSRCRQHDPEPCALLPWTGLTLGVHTALLCTQLHLLFGYALLLVARNVKNFRSEGTLEFSYPVGRDE